MTARVAVATRVIWIWKEGDSKESQGSLPAGGEGRTT